MPDLVLTYYNFDGRASTIRKVLSLSGIPFVDERITREEFLKLKPSLPFKKIPVMAVDGQVIAETQSILRYIGRIGGMYPPASEPVACMMIDEIIDSFDDFFENITRLTFIEPDEDKRVLVWNNLMEEAVPTAMTRLENRLAQIQEEDFFRKNASAVFIHEVVVWDWIDYFKSLNSACVPKTFVDSFKTLVGIYDKVAARPIVNQQQVQLQAPAPGSIPMPTKLKLTYFDMIGVAEQIRLALHIGAVQFDDERISFEEFKTRGNTFPNGQVPMLEVDGCVCGQSFAILRYVGTITGMYPVENLMAATKVDEMLSHIGDFYFLLNDSFKEQDQDKRRQLRENLMQGPIPEALDALDKRIAQWKHETKSEAPFAIASGRLTIADIVVYTLVEFLTSGSLDHVPTSVLDPHTHILQAHAEVKKHPRVQDWYVQHPQHKTAA